MVTIALLIAVCTLIYRKYAEFAFEHNKPRTGFGLLGVVIFLAGYTFCWVLAFLLIHGAGIVIREFLIGILVELVIIGSGALLALTVRRFLKKSWGKARHGSRSDLLDTKP
jgi:hypothetical protein